MANDTRDAEPAQVGRDDSPTEERGRRRRFPTHAPSSLPQRVAELPDQMLREHARDAWCAADRLVGAITFARQFLVANSCAESFDDPTHEAFCRVFPEVADAQVVLDHLASLPWGGRPEVSGPPAAFPKEGLVRLINVMRVLVFREAHALYVIGINSPSFRFNQEPPWGEWAHPLDGYYDLTLTPPRVPLKGELSEQLEGLGVEVKRFMELLARAPAAALLAPKTSGPSAPALRLVVDIDHESIVLDGQAYGVSRAGAAYVQALVRAGGLYRTEAQLCEDHTELAGKRHGRDVLPKLPEPIRKLVEVKQGSGHRLRSEDLV